MSSDIVERLRKVAGWLRPEFGAETANEIEKAADEIERLRAEVAKFAAIRETHAIVPREPTEAMLLAGRATWAGETYTAMDDFIPRNRAERIRKRAWRQIQLWRLASYEKLVALSFEAHLIR